MKLLVIQETDWELRGPHQQHHLFERLAQRGHDVTVMDFEIDYAPWPQSTLIQWTREFDCSRVFADTTVTVLRPGTIRLPALSRLLSVPSFWVQLGKYIRRETPDVIINYALSTGLPAQLQSKRFGVPNLMHVIDALPTLIPSTFAQQIARPIERFLLSRATRTLYINKRLEQYGIAHGASAKTVDTIRTGVDLQRFHPEIETQYLRERWGLAETDVVLCFVGFLYHFAGIDTIMRLLPSLPDNVKLLIVGSGDADESLRDLHTDLNLGERVIFTGRQPYDDMPAYMALADVCLMYAEINDVMRDIVPIKTYEYLAAGSPVLASELPGVMEDIPPGNGVLYIPAEQLEAELERLLDADYRQQIGAQARAFVEANCDWELLTTEFEALLARIAAKT